MEQHMKALEKANTIKLGRSKIRRDLFNGDIHITDVILDIPESIHSATLFEILIAMKSWGRVRALKLIQETGCTEFTTMDHLTNRQRCLLISKLHRR